MRQISQVILTLLCFFGLSAAANGQINVAVVDLGTVFETHPSFVSSMDQLKAEMSKYEQDHRKQQESMVTEFKQLRQMNSNSDEYRAKEIQLSRSSANLDIQKKLKAREFMQKEASIYYSTYNDVRVKINNFCKQNTIALVVHYNSAKMDLNNPKSIMSRINSNVIFARKVGGNIDITQTVQQMCGAKISSASRPSEMRNR